MLQSGDLQLNHVRQEISRKVAFPEELATVIDEASGLNLLDEIAACQDAEERLTLAYSLSRKRLNDLFGAVLTISAAAGEGLFSHLLEIFRLRATLSLTHTAWAYYQRQYPNDRLGRVLSTLVKALPEKENSPTFLKEFKQVTIDHLLPRRLAERLHNPATKAAARLLFSANPAEQAESAPELEEHVPVARLREKYPLLTAYTSLAALPEQHTGSSCLNSSLCGYMVRLSILPDTTFAAAFMTAWFQDAQDPDLFLNTDLFIQALRISRRPAQIALLHRYLNDYRLSRNWDPINQAILRLCGMPDLQQAAPAKEKAQQPDKVSHNPFLTDDSKRRNTEAPPAARASALPETAQADNRSAAEPSRSEPAEKKEQPDHGKTGRQKGLLNWMLGRREKTAAEEAAAEAQNGQTHQPKAPATVESLTNKAPDQEQRLIELEQTLLAGIQQPELLAEAQPAAASDSIWQQLDPSSALRFRQWAFMNQIGLHGADQRKLHFLQRYALQIRAVQQWDEKTQLVEVDGFFLVNHQEEESCFWYYDHNTISMLAESRNNTPLNRPEQPLINSREAMLQETVSNIVRLPLDAVNLLYAHDFIQRVRQNLKERKA